MQKGVVHSHVRMGRRGLERVKEYRRIDPGGRTFQFALNSPFSISDFESGSSRAYDAVIEASENLIKEQISFNNKFNKLSFLKDEGKVSKALKYVGRVIKDKLDVVKQFKEIKELGKKHGKGFLAYAIAIEIFEDVILPAFFTKLGHPEMTPILLAWHSEWFMYPLYFAIKKRMGKNKIIKKSFYYVVKLSG